MKKILYTLPLLLALLACHPDAKVPADSIALNDTATIFPDYRDIVIPPNIAPLNFMIQEEGEAFVARIAANGKEIVAVAAEDGKIQLDPTAWRQLLENNKGKDLQVDLFCQRDSQWFQFPSYKLHVAQEDIDPFLAYRLIEPSYELYRQMGIYQRNLTNFEEKAVYENNRSYESDNNHCVNCHNFQNYSTQRMLFHVRAKHGGTVFINNGKAQKMNMKCDSILSSTVYPTWHPEQNWIVFSSNRTGQAFHIVNHQKVEVIDYGSDLVFFNADKGTLTNIFQTKDKMETYPNWCPDGKRLFYCCAEFPIMAEYPDSLHSDLVLSNYNKIRYNLMSVDFDAAHQTFGEPRIEFRCDSIGKSATWPRVSPDGRYVLFTLADYGQFHIWHRTSDLYVKDLHTGEIRPLTAANSADIDSNHNWSSNGRWIVVASRRDDGSYTRVYIAYFDANGRDYKAFLLPQEDPEQNLHRLKSYNLPELTKDAIPVGPEELKATIYNDKDIPQVKYAPAQKS